MSDIRVGTSPLTGTIFAGRLSKTKTCWVGKKFDVTDDCMLAVVQRIKIHRQLYERDGKTYELKEVEVCDE